jgi:nitroimidazol reductase NimA-like FMN-containing flavoprotein (pyridoxamine 5'-phosphate oxidase superfamily)
VWGHMNSTTLPDGKLSIDECWEQLAADTLGRLAVVVDGHPDIFPVNYVLDRRSIVFRTAGGTKLWSAMTARPAALEIDGYDTRTEIAWSVVVRGVTDVIVNDEEKAVVDALHLEPWQPGAKNHYVRLTARAMTGRRFKVNKPELWTTRLSDPRRASFE